MRRARYLDVLGGRRRMRRNAFSVSRHDLVTAVLPFSLIKVSILLFLGRLFVEIEIMLISKDQVCGQ